MAAPAESPKSRQLEGALGTEEPLASGSSTGRQARGSADFSSERGIGQMTLSNPRDLGKPRPRVSLRFAQCQSQVSGTRPMQMFWLAAGRYGSVGGRARGKGGCQSQGHSPVGGVATHGSSNQDSRQVDRLGHGLQGVGVTHQVPLVREEWELSPEGRGHRRWVGRPL